MFKIHNVETFKCVKKVINGGTIKMHSNSTLQKRKTAKKI